MTDLPINISNVSAKPVSSKPSGNDDVAPQDGQEFGNVLARQVSDSGKPTESDRNSSGDAAKQSAEQNTVDQTPLTDIANILPGDMLAALLAQQGQMAATQTVNLAQPVENSGKSVVASGKQENALLAFANGKLNPAANAAPGLDAALTELAVTSQDNKDFADTFKTLGIKELSSPGSHTLHTGAIGELANPVQPFIIPAALPGAILPSSPLSISTAVTHPAWGDEFNQKITWLISQHSQSAELHLNPPQLGPLDVVLKMNGDQATATFTSPHAAVREAIEQALPKLRDMLADSGIMLGNAMVNDQAAKNHQDNSSGKAQEGTRFLATGTTAEPASIVESRVSAISRHHGMVDTFA